MSKRYFLSPKIPCEWGTVGEWTEVSPSKFRKSAGCPYSYRAVEEAPAPETRITFETLDKLGWPTTG